MRTISKLLIGTILSTLLFLGCKKDEEVVVTGYLENSTEYTNLKSLSAANIRGYLEQYGQGELASKAQFDVKVYKIEYRTALKGDSITASGVVAIPVSTKKKDAFPMLSYQHGVILSKNDAPSVDPLGDFSAFPIYLASTGFIVIIPDYIGFGESDHYDHPFMHKESMASSVVDLIRASKEFVVSGKMGKTDGDIFLTGYGEGATATFAALNRIESDTLKYSDIRIKASGCGSGFYDFARFREWLLTQVKFDQPWYFSHLLESYTTYAGLTTDYSLFLNEPYASQVSGMVDGVRSYDQMNDIFGTKSLNELLAAGFKDDEQFNSDPAYSSLRQAFSDNSIPIWNLHSNVTIYYGKNDTWVPTDQSLYTYSKFKDFGVTTNLKINAMEGLDHESASIPMIAKSVLWFRGL